MSDYLFSTRVNGEHIAFDVAAYALIFDDAAITASAVRVVVSGGSIAFSVAGKTVWLDGLKLEGLALQNLQFANGSKLLFGDGMADTFHDAYGHHIDLGASKVGNQVWGLGGADLVVTGRGGDWLVGNARLAPIDHVSRDGSTGSPHSSSHATVSADGRYVAFDGDWAQFGASGDGVIVKDMNTGTFTDEHRNAAGKAGASGAGSTVISADGKVVAFSSASANLVAGPDSTALYDIFVSDPHGTEILRASTGTGGALAADGRALNPDLSGTGRYVVFESDTSSYAAGGSTLQTDIFLKDLVDDTTTRLSTSLTSTDGNGDSRNAKISADGEFVVFQSAASNLTAGDGNGYSDIFLWDAGSGSLSNITKGLVPVSNPNNGNFNPDVAYNGDENAVVVFETARNLVAADTSNGTDVYAYNFKSKTLQLVSSKADGSGVALSSGNASISDDGRWVVFTSGSDALVAGDANGYADIFVKDLFTGRIALVSRAANGNSANQASNHAHISSGGDWIVFESAATNLAATDVNGSFTDVFRVANPLLVDTLQGGAGNDTYILNRNDTVVEAVGGGTDTLQASISYTLPSNVENLTLTGTANLNGTGNALANLITGNAGSNRLDSGAGVDTVSYANATAAVTVSLALAGAQATGFGNDTVLNFENLTGSRFNDRLTGNAAANRLDGGLGNDTMVGGEGSDTYVSDSSADIVSELGTTVGNIDTVISSVNWTLGGTLENLTLTGTTAIRGNGNNAANVLTGNAASNTMSAGGGNDTVYGGAGNDRLDGSTGNDRLDGGLGNDTMTGGEGSDTYVTDSLADIVVESGTTAGNVDAVISSVSWTLGGTLENLTLTGTTAIRGNGNNAANQLTGNAANNTMSAGGGNDTLYGGAGNDRLDGGTGNDRLDGGLGNDTMTGGEGSDTYVTDSSADIISETGTTAGNIDTVISGVNWTLGGTLENLTLTGSSAVTANGNSQNNVLTGNAIANLMNGGAGNDILSGAAGNDSLTGSVGNDRLTGGSGADRFVMASLVGSDTITDFVSATDKFVVRQPYVKVGDGDIVIEGGVTRAAPGGFSNTAELVVFTTNVASLGTTAAAAAIGSATAAYAADRTALFVVDTGASTGVFLFHSLDGNKAVSAAELSLLATLSGTAHTALGDYLFTA